MEDRVKLTADDSDYQAVMRRAGNTADQFTTRIERANKRFTSLFKRDPGQRAETAVSHLVSGAATGDIAGGITGFLSKLSGIGLVAGVAVSAGIAVFQKFKKQIEETNDAHEALRMNMLTRPLSIVGKLSDEGMAQALGESQKLVKDLTEKTEKRFGSQLLETGKSVLALGDVLGSTQRPGADDTTRLEREQDINKEIAKGKAIMEAQVALAATHLNIRRGALTASEKDAEIAKIVLEAEQEREALRSKPGMTNKIFEKADEVISENAELSISQVKKKAKLKETELKMEERIATLQHKGLAGEELKRVRAGLEIKALDEQIATETSPEARRALKLERAQKVNAAHGLLDPSGSKNKFAFGTAASRGFEQEFGAGGFTRRSIEDSLSFGGLARGSMDRGESLTPEEALLKTGTSAADIAGFQKNVGDLPGGKSADAEVVKILTEVKTIIEQAWAKP